MCAGPELGVRLRRRVDDPVGCQFDDDRNAVVGLGGVKATVVAEEEETSRIGTVLADDREDGRLERKDGIGT